MNLNDSIFHTYLEAKASITQYEGLYYKKIYVNIFAAL
jgi:hypothetical protein